MRVLVLGGTHHVGRSVVEAALGRGDEVTTCNRGRSRPPAPGVRALVADRTDHTGLAAALDGGTWDLVVDTWTGAPADVLASARVLADRADRYAYVSSRSVYTWPVEVGADESAPVVEADPAATTSDDYAAAKRGGELAALDAFGDRALLARAGLILGPYEAMGRMPWWLRRLERGGPVLAPGPPDRGLQYVDGRDLAEWILEAGAAGASGPVDTVSPPGHATMGQLLDVAATVTGGGAELVWVSPETVEEAGIEPWTELPIWLPPTGEAAGLHAGDTSLAASLGLRCRPVEDTVADTWAWLLAEGDPPSLAAGSVGWPAEREAEVLAGLG